MKEFLTLLSSNVSVKALFICVILTYHGASTVSQYDTGGLKSQQNSVPVQGLYSSEDHVVILNATNIKSIIYGSKTAWLVQFYNSWCGFCQRYAPLWKEFVLNILEWRPIVTLAVIDCADEENTPTCRNYEIMHNPTLKFFSSEAKPESLGIPIEKGKDTDAMRYNLIKHLEKEQQEGRGYTWPNIAPYRNPEIKSVWKGVPKEVNYYFFIIEAASSYMGVEVILDLHSISSIRIRRVSSDNELFCITNKVVKFPSVMVVDRNESHQFLPVTIPTREGVKKVITQFLQFKGIDTKVQVKDSSENRSSRLDINISKNQNIHKNTSDILEDVLHLLDLENALRYSLSHEISLVKIIEGEKMSALKLYLDVLSKYFPKNYNVGHFLNVLRNSLNNRDTITGREFRQIVKSTEQKLTPIYSGPADWVGCKGSVKTYRGYPCGLWVMFHMLTVNHAISQNENTQHNFTKVLGAMHGYIKNFFGCSDCSKHFVEMAARNKIFEVRSANESVLWLWKAHNEVNKRLSGDETEDPKHKKIEYPSEQHCPECRHANRTWDQSQVLIYLRNKYCHNNIMVNKSNILSIKSKVFQTASDVKKEPLIKTESQPRSAWNFTIFDISICVVLYIVSATILVLVCIKFAVKRSSKKKHVMHSFLGRV